MHYTYREILRTRHNASALARHTGEGTDSAIHEAAITVRDAADAVLSVIPCPTWLLEVRIHELNHTTGALEIQKLRRWH